MDRTGPQDDDDADDRGVGGGSLQRGPTSKKRSGSTVKRLPSCDLCRARKVKCIKNSMADRCEGCVSLDQDCEYTHERKKPGPANSFARKDPPRSTHHDPSSSSGHYQRPSHYGNPYSRSYSVDPLESVYQSESAVRGSGGGPSGITTSSNLFSPKLAFPDLHPHYPIDPALSSDHPGHDSRNIDMANHGSGGVSGGDSGPNTGPHHADTSGRSLDLPFLPISPNSLMHPMPGEMESSDGSPAGLWPWNSSNSGWDARDALDARPSSSWHHNQPAGFDSAFTSQSTSEHARQSSIAPPGSDRGMKRPHSQQQSGAPVTRTVRVEDVLEWSVMMRILHAYHAHLYPLMAVVHWPSFSQQLIAREDEKSETWRAFLFSLVAYAVIQLPRSALTFVPVPELRRIHQRCHGASRALQNRRYTNVALLDVQTLYCQHIYLGTLGRTNAANVTLAEAIRISHTLGLHDERAAPAQANVVEREMRRRTFWLLYGSDRTITALTGDPLLINDADLCLPLPLCIDDNLLTPSGAFTQPPGTTPILAGFHYNCRLHRILGAVLTSHKYVAAPCRDSSADPFPILNCPPPQSGEVFIRPASHYFDELERLFHDLPGPLQLVNPVGVPTPNGSTNSEGTKSKEESGFAICRANLLVTQAIVRFAIRLYAKAIGSEEGGEGNTADWAEKDVLSLLESMSPESLAANGDSLRLKLLFVASALLEKYPSTTEGHNYVSDFLAVYNRISQEQHSSLLEPARSGEVSREPTPLPR